MPKKTESKETKPTWDNPPADGPQKVALPKPDERIFQSMPYAGFRAMQVCVLPEVPDAEILEFCNRVNPQLVTGGWHTVVRNANHAEKCGVDRSAAPGNCVECAGRLHKIVLCM